MGIIPGVSGSILWLVDPEVLGPGSWVSSPGSRVPGSAPWVLILDYACYLMKLFIKKETLAQVFSCEFCKISKKEHLFLQNTSGGCFCKSKAEFLKKQVMNWIDDQKCCEYKLKVSMVQHFPETNCSNKQYKLRRPVSMFFCVV